MPPKPPQRRKRKVESKVDNDTLIGESKRICQDASKNSHDVSIADIVDVDEVKIAIFKTAEPIHKDQLPPPPTFRCTKGEHQTYWRATRIVSDRQSNPWRWALWAHHDNYKDAFIHWLGSEDGGISQKIPFQPWVSIRVPSPETND